MRSPTRSRQLTAVSSVLVVLAPFTGCVREPKASAPAEPTFAEQAQAVRDGNSDQIRLDQTLVTDRDLDALEGLGPQLKRINLSRTEISDTGMERIAAMPELVQLRLASDRISDDAIRAVGRLEHLRFLHLIHAPITDVGLDHLHGLKQLESLYLDDTRATDAGIGRLVAALPGVHLHIDDHHHPLDPHGAEHSH